MAVTNTWTIQKERHNNRTEKFIYEIDALCTATETVGSDSYTKTKEVSKILLDKPDTLIAYDTFNKQATLVAAAKAKISDAGVTAIEAELAELIEIEKNPLETVPPS
jgi:hypothetical protein